MPTGIAQPKRAIAHHHLPARPLQRLDERKEGDAEAGDALPPP